MSEKTRFLCLASGVLVLLSEVGIQTPRANAAQEQDFFVGKTVRIIVPYATGGAFDRLARFVGTRIGSHIPGNPAVTVQNMPGGGGATATNYLYKVAPKDGTVMAILNPTLILPQLIGQQEIVLKSLGNYLKRVFAVSGATILGDGQVALIIDTNALVK